MISRQSYYTSYYNGSSFGALEYTYCANNPVKKIDPTGEDEFEFDKQGNLVNIIENKNADIVRVLGNNGKEKSSMSFKYGTIMCAGNEELRSNTNASHKVNATTIELKDNSNRKDMFKFLAENTDVEWSTLSAYNETDGVRNIISTSHSNGTEESGLAILDFDLVPKNSDILDFTHSHPDNIFQYSNAPSGYGAMYDGTPEGKGDKGVATTFSRISQSTRVYDARDKVFYNLYPNKYTKQ